MKTLRMTIDLTYDDEIMHSGDEDKEAKDWFFKMIGNDRLILHSNELGDEVGEVKVISLDKPTK